MENSLSEIKGIGKIRLEALHAAGIFSLRDLLYCVPLKYRDVSRTVTIAQASPGQRCGLRLLRQGEAKLARFKGKMTRTTCLMTDETGSLTACWFNQPWMKDNLNKQTRLLLYGTVEVRGGKKWLTNPSIETENRIVPIYRPIEGLPQRVHQSIVGQCLERVDELCQETLPASLIARHNLWPLTDAVRCLHAPQSMEELAWAQRRFAFEQMLLYQAAVRMVRDLRRAGTALPCPDALTNDYWVSLPFPPTGAQRRSLQEIAADMRKPRAMARMVQGDVGSGKTAVAMGAMLLCADAGYQCAMMAPTEILAHQHYQSMKEYFEGRGIACGLLVGGMPQKARREALEAIRTGRWQVVLGTHALISRDVRFARLGLCVTDEQHRFGVAQRTALLDKGAVEAEDRSPHLLVMSATPIPRSLALIMFGDLDISLIDEMPPGRLSVHTRIVPEDKRHDMYGFLRGELDAGRQAYIVCPLVEESEDADGLKAAKAHAAELARDELKGYTVGLTYGGQPAQEKQDTLNAFSRGQVQVLVATTVIEVGVNVPNASVMIIEGADHYGLAQLHQLRGRVGRGAAQSWCFLLAQPNDRLRALVRTNDGFEIARTDLELRGPGELLGTRQHGDGLLPGGSAALVSMPLLYEAAQCAEELFTQPERHEEWLTVRALAQNTLRVMGERVSVS